MGESHFHIRDIVGDDLEGLLRLYQHLHPDDPQLDDSKAIEVWRQMLGDPNHYCFVGCVNERLVASCVMLIVPNLTRGGRSYGLIENVVTHADFRKQGYGTQVLQHALSLAWEADCYKVMLTTGSKQESTLRFYDSAGFQRGVKTGFVAKPE